MFLSCVLVVDWLVGCKCARASTDMSSRLPARVMFREPQTFEHHFTSASFNFLKIENVNTPSLQNLFFN